MAANQNDRAVFQELSDEYGSEIKEVRQLSDEEIDDALMLPGTVGEGSDGLYEFVRVSFGQLRRPIMALKSALEEAIATAQNVVNNIGDAVSSANTAARLADEKAGLAERAASNADEKAGEAHTAAENATSIWNTVKNWFNGNNGFKATAESWYDSVTSAWNTLRNDITSKTNAANDAAALANEKASLANEKASLADEKASLADEKASIADQKAGFANEQGTRAKTYLDALQEELTDEAKQLLLGELCAPYIVGSTLVFPAQSTAKIVNSTLILAE